MIKRYLGYDLRDAEEKPNRNTDVVMWRDYESLLVAAQDLLFVIEVPKDWGPAQTKALCDAGTRIQKLCEEYVAGRAFVSAGGPEID